jgi:hypothetical protein
LKHGRIGLDRVVQRCYEPDVREELLPHRLGRDERCNIVADQSEGWNVQARLPSIDSM